MGSWFWVRLHMHAAGQLRGTAEERLGPSHRCTAATISHCLHYQSREQGLPVGGRAAKGSSTATASSPSW